MKKILFIVAVFLSLGYLKLSAQSALYGVAIQGGEYGYGTLFKFDYTTNTLEVKKSFNYSDGGYPIGKLLNASNGLLYGTTQSGGNNGYGTFFEYNPVTDVYTKKVDFDLTKGAFPYGHVIQLPNGDIVGTSYFGGANNSGTLWKYTISSNTLTKLADFEYSNTGAYSYSGVTLASNGKLYGLTWAGGTNDNGTLYEYDLQTSSLSRKVSFNSSNGAYGIGKLLEVNGKLYGVTYLGGSNGAGTIFEYNIASSVLTSRYNFDNGSNGGNPYVGLNKAANGLLYGTNVSGGGQDGLGAMFSFDPQSGNVNNVHDFNYDTEGYAYNPVMQASDGNLYGMIHYGGNNTGLVYKYNTTSAAFTALQSFDYSTTGAYPFWTELTEVGGTHVDPCTTLTASSVAGTIACQGGSTTVTVSATGGTAPYSGTGNFTATAGTHTYSVTDAKGCTATTVITLTEPAQLVVNAGNNQTVYYGYSPSGCVTLNGTATGGTASYTYLWSNGAATASTSVCPSVSTSYKLTVTDAKGCVANDIVTVCSIDVRCDKGGKAIVYYEGGKVVVCHVPDGNIAKREIICISPDAVPAHLAHGDQLGICGINAACTVGDIRSLEENTFPELIAPSEMTVLAFPNPFNNTTIIGFNCIEDERITIKVYNTAGVLVADLLDEDVKAGEIRRDVTFNGSELPSGMYFAKVTTSGGKVIVRKLLLNK